MLGYIQAWWSVLIPVTIDYVYVNCICMHEWCVLALWGFVLQKDLCSVRAVIIAESDQQAGKNFKLAFSWRLCKIFQMVLY